jgi:O-antigen ligase
VAVGTGLTTLGGLAQHVLGAGTPSERLDLPLGYANGSGMLAAVTLVLALGLTSDGPRWRRVVGAGLAPPAATVLYLTLSRGAVLACMVGLVVLAATGRPAASLLRAAPAALFVGLAVGAALLGSFGDRGVSVEEAGSLGVVGCFALAAALLTASPVGAPAIAVRARVPARAVAGVAAMLVAGIGAFAVHEVRDVRLQPVSEQGAPRIFSASTSYRSDYWRVAARMVDDAPIVGEGAGGFERVWLRERPGLVYVRDAHNLYLESIAEVGVVGLGALVVALLAPLAGFRRLVGEPVARAALAAYVALLAHAALDWDWEIPAVTVPTVLLAVALAKTGERGATRALTVAPRACLLAAALALGLAAVVVHAGNTAMDAAREALDRNDAVEAEREAARARRFAPWSAEPWRLLGDAEVAAGRVARGREHIRRSLSEDPDAWESWLALAFATDGPARARAVAAARALNPLAPELLVFDEADP